MRLKTSSYVLLGMLQRGVATGYAIKRDVERSTRFFWSASLAQVYPELAALEAGGHVVSADEPHGDRPRKTYRLTAKGQRALEGWLRSERLRDFEFRDEGLLRLFFADAVPLGDALALVRRMRARAEELEREFRAEVLPVAERVPGRFTHLVAREGADYFGWRAGWLREVEQELERELAETP
ncbi:MAG TPA: PadR family transcriptional regulator [Capillimicrobium sp.]|jgi:DNA-binding PadR family transcriptional regulator